MRFAFLAALVLSPMIAQAASGTAEFDRLWSRYESTARENCFVVAPRALDEKIMGFQLPSYQPACIEAVMADVRAMYTEAGHPGKLAIDFTDCIETRPAGDESFRPMEYSSLCADVKVQSALSDAVLGTKMNQKK